MGRAHAHYVRITTDGFSQSDLELRGSGDVFGVKQSGRTLRLPIVQVLDILEQARKKLDHHASERSSGRKKWGKTHEGILSNKQRKEING